jgi:hypothetical protein
MPQEQPLCHSKQVIAKIHDATIVQGLALYKSLSWDLLITLHAPRLASRAAPLPRVPR